ncbi:MAG: NAD-dependent epimerase/dehydratase family protein [Patescibacteria group bacterium]
MRVFLTGAAGFIGSHTAEALLKRGDEVLGVDDLNDYYDVAQKEANLQRLRAHAGFEFVREDIRAETMEKLMVDFKPDVLLHLAARAGVRPSIKDPELYYDVNLRGTVNLLESCRKAGVQQVIFASSSSVYGAQEKVPFSEGDFTENPLSPYAATKRAGENIIYSYSKMFGMKATCLRFFTVYGPAGRPDMAPFLFTKKINEGQTVPRFGDGGTARDYTYVADIVSGIVAAVDKPFDFEIFNLGHNEPVQLNVLISTIEELLGKKAVIEELPEQPGDVPVTFADISKAQKMLGYQPNTSIKEGMQEFVNWYLKR